MIHVNQALCEGCGVCVEQCPTEAITLSDGQAVVDVAFCDGCGSFNELHNRLCIEICPQGALSWAAAPVPESAMVVVEPAVEVIPAAPTRLLPQSRAILPAVGGALTWVGREVVPRLAPLALAALDSALDRRISRWARNEDTTPAPAGQRGDQGRQQRRRRRRGR